MKDERHHDPAERGPRVEEEIRSLAEVRADAGFRERLKREFVSGTIADRALPRVDAGARKLPRWGWLLVPAAALAVWLIVVLLPAPAPTWAVLAAHGEGEVEIDGQTLAGDEPDLVARALGAGGRVRVSEKLSLDLRLDDLLVLELDAGSDVTVPVPLELGASGPLISEVHDGELRIKTGPGFPGQALHILTAEGRTELVGTVISVYKGVGYTCICVLEGTALVGKDQARLEEIGPGMLKVMLEDERPSIVTEIAAKHEMDLRDFAERHRDAFSPPR